MLYQHYKGGFYELLHDNATDESTGVIKVVYQSALDQRIWIRDRDEFFGYVVNENDETVRRFERYKPKVKIPAVTLAEKCGGCRFYDTKSKFCNEHHIRRQFEDDKCNDWRYFA